MRITRTDIQHLADEAGAAGDLEMVAIARRALTDGREEDWAECERVIAEAAAQ